MHTGLSHFSTAAFAGIPAPSSTLSRNSGSALQVPRSPTELAAQYDLTISHPEIEQVCFRAFDDWLAQAAAARGLSCGLIHDGVVEAAIERLHRGRLRIGFHLDYFALWHVPQDPFARLTRAVQHTGGLPVNPPACAQHYTDKAIAHGELRQQGLGVPASLVVPAGAKDATLTEEDLRPLDVGASCASVFVKLANGFGGKGVVRVEHPDPNKLLAAVRAVRQHDEGDAVLLQRGVRCPRLKLDDGSDRSAYWRVLYCLGELLPFWWNGGEAEQGRPNYRRLTEAEVQRHRLRPVLDYVSDLAEICELEWFSTELCLSEAGEPSRHGVDLPDGRTLPVLAIDYVNDQCDVDVQSRWLGAPPDEVVRHVAERFAEAAWRARRLALPFAAPVRIRPAA